MKWLSVTKFSDNWHNEGSPQKYNKVIHGYKVILSMLCTNRFFHWINVLMTTATRSAFFLRPDMTIGQQLPIADLNSEACYQVPKGREFMNQHSSTKGCDYLVQQGFEINCSPWTELKTITRKAISIPLVLI